MTMTELSGLVTMRLATLGYTVAETDAAVLDYVTGHAAQYVCNSCNFRKCPDDIPDALKYVTADYAVGEFLQQKMTFAPDDISGISLDYAVKQIQTGDTNTVFATGDGSTTPEQRLTAFIDYLMTYGKDMFASFRRLKW